MVTYQDLLKVGQSEEARKDFVLYVIRKHKASQAYKTAIIADEYDRRRNRTIVQFQKLLYDISGRAIPDNYSANYKLCSGFFHRFVTQQNQYLLGNGVSWGKPETAEKLGAGFDHALQSAGRKAIVGGQSFGFWNYDHMDVFGLDELAPLYDEATGGLAAAVRFYQIDSDKPLRATLYEKDGYTDYLWAKNHMDGEIVSEKRPYVLTLARSAVDGVEILDGRNYADFPIVPLYANLHKQSELVGMQEQIDAYDLIRSGYCNTIDEASFIYWAIQNAGGMGDIDLVKFVERMKTLHAGLVEDSEAKAEPHQLEAPYQGREALLDRLEKDMYRDYMALNTDDIKGGAVTATQIRAAYEPMNSKADEYEYCIDEFLAGILQLAGIEDTPSFVRSVLVNTQEEISALVSASSYLSSSYLTRRILTLLGDGDKAEEVLAEIDGEDLDRIGGE